MSHLGKMPNWQKAFVIGGMLACSISGCLYLIGHEFQIHRSVLGNHTILATHGIFAMLATLALGSVLPFHLKAGIKSKKKWISGFSQLGFLITLISTGALLYYGPEEIRDIAVSTHWIAGLIFLLVFLLHVIFRLASFNTLALRLLQATNVHGQQASPHLLHVQHLDNPASQDPACH